MSLFGKRVVAISWALRKESLGFFLAHLSGHVPGMILHPAGHLQSLTTPIYYITRRDPGLHTADPVHQEQGKVFWGGHLLAVLTLWNSPSPLISGKHLHSYHFTFRKAYAETYF